MKKQTNEQIWFSRRTSIYLRICVIFTTFQNLIKSHFFTFDSWDMISYITYQRLLIKYYEILFLISHRQSNVSFIISYETVFFFVFSNFSTTTLSFHFSNWIVSFFFYFHFPTFRTYSTFENIEFILTFHTLSTFFFWSFMNFCTTYLTTTLSFHFSNWIVSFFFNFHFPTFRTYSTFENIEFILTFHTLSTFFFWSFMNFCTTYFFDRSDFFKNIVWIYFKKLLVSDKKHEEKTEW